MEKRMGFVLVLSFIVLASFTSMTPALASEIWVTPSTFGLTFPSGNWPVSTYPWSTFSFAVPDNMTAFESAKLVVIGKVSTTLTYSLGLSIGSNGDPQNYYTDSATGLKATLTKNQLQEIDISSYIPTGKKPGGFKIEPGDYIGINFQVYPATAVNVLGLRFQYEGPLGPQGPQGEKGDPGVPGHSPVLSWSGDQISIDGEVTGPHLTGPQGPTGTAPALGPWQEKSRNTVYFAATDGFVLAYASGPPGALFILRGFTDSSNPPTTVRTKLVTMNLNSSLQEEVSIMMPVRKGDFWKLESGGWNDKIYWLPFGN
jgi:hypothetical protein